MNLCGAVGLIEDYVVLVAAADVAAEVVAASAETLRWVENDHGLVAAATRVFEWVG